MKQFFFVAVGLLILLSLPCSAQRLEPLNPDWLADDYRSMELISLLASPAPLTTQKILDMLGVSDKDDAEEDLGFGATFYKRPGTWCSWCDYLPVCMEILGKQRETSCELSNFQSGFFFWSKSVNTNFAFRSKPDPFL